MNNELIFSQLIFPLFKGISSFFVSWFLIKLLIPILLKFFPDQPNDRSSHEKIKPRGGGIVFVLVTLIYSINSHSNIILVSSFLAFVSFIDDKIHLSSLFRYVVQLITVLLLIKFSNGINLFGLSHTTPLIYLAILFIYIIFFTALINFTNFMDGIDGLVSGCMSIILFTSAFLLHFDWIPALIGSLLAFLFWNWEPSKLFMGDVGSTFLGSVFVGILINADTQTFFGLLIVSSPLLLDALTCVFRRLFNSQPIFKAHKLHLYQRLNQAGIKHNKIAFTYIFATFLLSISLLTGGITFACLVCIFVIVFGIYLDKKVAVPFLHLI